MSKEKKVKILLIGPVSTGKTTLANFLSDPSENPFADTRPTKGVRILEFTVTGVRGRGVYENSVEIELWDCSGDTMYQSCWPAIQRKTDGIIFVYSENSPEQKAELETLYKFFVEESNFPENCCLVIKNQFASGGDSKTSSNPFQNLDHAVANLDENGNEFKKVFNNFLPSIIKGNLYS